MPRIVLLDRAPDERVPELFVYVADSNLKPIAIAKVDEQGSFDLREEALGEASYVAIGAAGDHVERLARDEAIFFRPRQFAEFLRAGTIDLTRPRWEKLLLFTRCVSGRISWCRWRWPLIDAISPVNLPARVAAEHFARLPSASAVSIERPDLNLRILPLRRCRPVCEGVVEVYLRRCCWKPLVVFDPRIDELLDALDRIPTPIPDPGPVGPDLLPFLKGGVPDELALYAARDRVTIRALSPAERPAYIEARSYLKALFHCGDPKPVGSGFLGLDGEFQVCWKSPPSILIRFCRDEVAYVVKQLVDGVTITVYDGVAAGQWYALDETPTITTYDPRAIVCRGPEDPVVSEAAAFLELIGDAPSHELATPAPSAWDRVGAPAFNSGLLHPASTLEAAKGEDKNCNLGGVLQLLYRFSESLRDAGARYYRVTVQRADDATGAPVPGTAKRLGPAGGRWRKFRFSGGSIQLLNVPLGVSAVPSSETDLWTIPYEADLPSNEEWLANQYHAQLDTTAFANGRHLLTLEVFDIGGNRLRPTGAAGAGADAAFHFHLWEKSGAMDSFPNVPFAGLTHLLWWDNRVGVGDIEGVRVSGSEPSGTCLFLAGAATDPLEVRYRAYHPVGMFLKNYALICYRGLEGAVQAPPTIQNGVLPVTDATANAGQPPADAAFSTGVPFATLLGPHTQCTFAVNLTMTLKTTNGSDWLYRGRLRDTIAFALGTS
jgi:hypothetical protein